jgi:hypothetical protein
MKYHTSTPTGQAGRALHFLPSACKLFVLSLRGPSHRMDQQTCHGCRLAPARFCKACVSHAMSKEQGRLRELHVAKQKLERMMVEDIKARRARLKQIGARSVHNARVAGLKARIASVRRETDGLAHQVNRLRHEVRRFDAAKLLPLVHAKVAVGVSDEAAMSVDMRLTKARMCIVRELFRLYRDVWFYSSAEDAVAVEAHTEGDVGGEVGSGGGGGGGGGGGASLVASLASLTSLAPSLLSSSCQSLVSHSEASRDAPQGGPPGGGGGGAAAAAEQRASHMGLALLLLQRCAECLSLGCQLPHRGVFQGSTSYLLRSQGGQPIYLERERCASDKEWSDAMAMLHENVRFVLDHVPPFPLAPPLSQPGSPPAPPQQSIAGGDAPTTAANHESGTGECAASGVVGQLSSLLDAPSLAWELHIGRCPLWAQQPPEDMWAIVDPQPPPPDATPDEIEEWEQLYAIRGRLRQLQAE